MQSYSKQLAAELRETDFLEQFLEIYFRNGFGSLPKREVDLLLLELAATHAPSWRQAPPTYELARNLRISPRKLRALLDQVAYRDERKDEAWCRDQLLEALRRGEKLPNGSYVSFQIDDALVRDFAEQRVRKLYGVVDSSFNPAIVKLSGEKFAALVLELLGKEGEAILKAIPKSERQAQQDARGSKGPVRLFIDAFADKLGGVAAEKLIGLGFDLLTGAPVSLLKSLVKESFSSAGQPALSSAA